MTAVPDLSPLPPLDRQAVGRALSKIPDERFPTCAEFVRAIRGDETPAPPPRPSSSPELRLDRRRDPNDTDVPGGPTQMTPRTDRRSVPALVTRGTKLSHSTTASNLRRPGQRHGLRPADQPAHPGADRAAACSSRP